MEQIKIDLVPNGVMSVAHASQFDVGRSMKFLLTDEGVTYTLAGTEVITLKLRKPDGTDDTISLVNTSSSYVEWTTVDGDLDLSGVYLAEITITSGDDVLGTANFLLKVEADPYDGANVRTVTVGPADICTFETTLPEPLQSVIVDIEATGGNGTPDSPIPINGYTEANITRCGVNLFDEETVYSAYKIANNRFKGTAAQISNVENSLSKYIGQTVTISCFFDLTVQPSPTRIYIASTINGTTYSSADVIQGNSGIVSLTVTPATANDIFKINWGSGGSNYFEFGSIQIEKSNTASDFTPYNGQTYTIAFGQTVYGGVLDVTRGKLHVTHGYVDLGSLSWNKFNTTSPHWRFRAFIDDIKRSASSVSIADIKCPIFSAGSPTDTWIGTTPYIIASANDADAIFVVDEDYSDADAFTTSMNGIICVYELATPFDIDLTPEVISAVVGTNNVFADCGETTVKYLKVGA